MLIFPSFFLWLCSDQKDEKFGIDVIFFFFLSPTFSRFSFLCTSKLGEEVKKVFSIVSCAQLTLKRVKESLYLSRASGIFNTDEEYIGKSNPIGRILPPACTGIDSFLPRAKAGEVFLKRDDKGQYDRDAIPNRGIRR